MLRIEKLSQFSPTDLRRIGDGYISKGKYKLIYHDSDDDTSFSLEYIDLDKPFRKEFHHYDDDTFERYSQMVKGGFSFGAIKDDELIGIIIAEKNEWNKSVWVWEFHVEENSRQKGIGRKLMDALAQRSKKSKIRTIICETQNVNAQAIKAYRKLGFKIEAIDISYYTNNDYPDGEIAVFMKKRL